MIRILPLKQGSGLFSGKVVVQTLLVDPAIATVDFFLDGERVARRKLPPFEAKLALADPPREQVVRVMALDLEGRLLGDDERVLNRIDPPFRVHIAEIAGEIAAGSVELRAEISVPPKAELQEVVFFRGTAEVARLVRPPFAATVPTDGVTPEDYVRVLATLADGRQLEDVELLAEGTFTEEVDVRLVQLQLLVIDRRGAPVTGLGVEDFEVVDAGKRREVERLYPSEDVALVLGLAIDSSGSMEPFWNQTRSAARSFLERALSPRDRAFLVDFDSQLRLLQALTGNKDELYAALSLLQPQGGTALWDSILFSMLQYDGEPGRRALIVLSDGLDSESRGDPTRAVDFGKRLGVPVYAIAMNDRRAWSVSGFKAENRARSKLTLITEPTGGRLFQALSPEQVGRAFAQIQDELRHQYVLTFHTDRPPGVGKPPVVRVLRKGLKVKTALPLDLAN